ncbi:MAG: hypothetical protein KGP28_01600 [Bdellovibrionales bacterium]|nr:hypothetical protein [Bdellovibrionales bacterium]
MKKKLILGVLGVGIVSSLIWILSRSGNSPTSTGEPDAGSGARSVLNQIVDAVKGTESKSTAAVSPAAASEPQGLSAEESRKLSILSEIIASKNDNDQRFDTELRNLSPEAKRALVRKYAEVRPEKRNELGTYVFLIGREIKDEADVAFLKSVLMEKPCLSLENCERPPEGQSGDEEHLGAINETTANYPQLVAIRAIRHKLDELKEQGQESGALFASLLQALREIRVSPNPRVVDEATKSLKELDRE